MSSSDQLHSSAIHLNSHPLTSNFLSSTWTSRCRSKLHLILLDFKHSNDSSTISELPGTLNNSFSGAYPESAEEATYLLEMVQADLEVRCIERELADRLLFQLQVHTHYWQLKAKKAQKQFGHAEMNVGQGRAALQSLVQDNKEAYHALSKQEQDDLLKEFVEHRDTKTTGARKNHQQLISDTLTSIRKLINVKLQEITGEPHVTMQWTHYFHNVVQCYQIVIKGWLDNINFTNLSNVSSALLELQMLEQWWKLSATKWVTIDDDELERLHLECDEQLERASQKVTTCWRRKHKSAEFIESSDKEDEPDQPPSSPASPVAQSTVVGSVDESRPSTNDPPQFNFNTESTPSINKPT
ncbi:uncharacterized protein F5891DRAFT_1186056 [Suillus fuscotomentosus]|uniref:Uncharacterized protein n=1 Tax=Suillus fuscotomentosus TaxID=1912939 RepID=A0AAD4EDG0_9AGAM|nr:uncharacterized protein F5891DRAFT_1186056 [Suillus fuscotomentosus]KAG1902913.1 hypothetical protein F5891DRAFT_1186056 [Suillus fuscotomentosus]